jgi:hypothetical protein
MVTTLLELAGFALIAAACFLIALPLGLAVAGVLLVVIAQATDRRQLKKPKKAEPQ